MLKSLAIKSRLVFLTAFLSVQLIVGGIIGLVSLNNATHAMKSIYDDRLVPLGQMDQIIRHIMENRSLIANAVLGSTEEIDRRVEEVGANLKRIDEVWQAFMTTPLTPEEKRLADEFMERSGKLVNEGLKPAIAALHLQDVSQAVALLNGPITELYHPARESVNALIQLQLDEARLVQEKSQQTYEWVFMACFASIVFGIILAILVSIWIIRSIAKPLERAVQVAGAVAAGDLTQQIEPTRATRSVSSCAH